MESRGHSSHSFHQGMDGVLKTKKNIEFLDCKVTKTGKISSFSDASRFAISKED